MWTAESRDKEDKPMRDPGSITDSAALKARPFPIPAPSDPPSTNAYSAKPRGVVSPKRPRVPNRTLAANMASSRQEAIDLLCGLVYLSDTGGARHRIGMGGHRECSYR